MKLTLVTGNQWGALYLDGWLYEESVASSIEPDDLVEWGVIPAEQINTLPSLWEQALEEKGLLEWLDTCRSPLDAMMRDLQESPPQQLAQALEVDYDRGADYF
jgi:hypothetical protein